IWIDSEEMQAKMNIYDTILFEKIQYYYENIEESINKVNRIKENNKEGFCLGYIQNYQFECLGKPYDLELHIHDRLRDYMEWKERLVDFIERKAFLIIFFEEDVTYRDRNFVSFLRQKEGKADFVQFLENYQKLLPESEIHRTLDKLVAKGYLTQVQGNYEITLKGRCI
ncbi:MAG: hypothetical protein SFU27_04445, partial [Thermonemataceae bacterium]|nr:hypothetical protein [Thermonemataceae bacterium]